MKQAEDTVTREIQLRKPGRPVIGDRPMTAAERKARSRANAVAELDGKLAAAERLASEWRRCMADGRPGATDADIQAAFAEIALQIAAARLAIPRS